MVLKDQEVIFKMLVEFGHIRTRALISPTIRRKSTDLVPEKIAPFSTQQRNNVSMNFLISRPSREESWWC